MWQATMALNDELNRGTSPAGGGRVIIEMLDTPNAAADEEFFAVPSSELLEDGKISGWW
jgi:hypothetical protein